MLEQALHDACIIFFNCLDERRVSVLAFAVDLAIIIQKSLNDIYVLDCLAVVDAVIKGRSPELVLYVDLRVEV